MVGLVAAVAALAAAQLVRALVEAAVGAVAFARAYRFQATDISGLLDGVAGALRSGEEAVPLLAAGLPASPPGGAMRREGGGNANSNAKARGAPPTSTPPRGNTGRGEVEMSAAKRLIAAEDVVVEDPATPGPVPLVRIPSMPDAALPPPPEPLVLLDAFRLVDAWDVLAAACELMLLAYCCSLLASVAIGEGLDLSERGWQLPLAAAATGLWLSTFRFLEHDPLFYAGVLTLQEVRCEKGFRRRALTISRLSAGMQALPEIGRFFVGCAPLFIALGLFDLIVFWKVRPDLRRQVLSGCFIFLVACQEPRYSTPNMVFMTLWAVSLGRCMRTRVAHAPPPGSCTHPLQTLLGDAVRETFQHTEDPTSVLRTLVADLQLVALFLMFTYIVVNCSVAIVEGKFFATFSTEASGRMLERQKRQAKLLSAIRTLLQRQSVKHGRRYRG